MDYLAAMQKQLKYEDIPKIKNYAKTKQWWDTIDGLDRIIGDIGLADNRVDGLMIQWSEDKDFWIRRIAIDHQLLRKEKTNTDLLSKIICNNFGSEEFFINKAIGWSLREYSKCNPKWVKDFVEKHKDRMAKLSVKEATKYV
jgi:3-methyladenine DNA glycosylase AlkD